MVPCLSASKARAIALRRAGRGVFGVSCLSWCATFLQKSPMGLPVTNIRRRRSSNAATENGPRGLHGAIRTLVSVRLLGLLLWALWCGATNGQAAISSLLNHLPSPIASGEFWLAMGGMDCVALLYSSGRDEGHSHSVHRLGTGLHCSNGSDNEAGSGGNWCESWIPRHSGFLALLNFAMVLPVSLGGLAYRRASCSS